MAAALSQWTDSITTTAIDIDSSGDNTIKTPASGKKLHVLGLLLMSVGGVNVVPKMGSTAQSGPLPLGTLCLPLQPIGGITALSHFSGAADEAFKLNLDAAVQVSGFLQSIETDV